MTYDLFALSSTRGFGDCDFRDVADGSERRGASQSKCRVIMFWKRFSGNTAPKLYNWMCTVRSFHVAEPQIPRSHAILELLAFLWQKNRSDSAVQPSTTCVELHLAHFDTVRSRWVAHIST